MIKKVLVSQPKPSTEKSPYYDIAEKFGVEIVFRPFIKVVGLSANEFRQQRVDILQHKGVVFTSRHSIDIFFQMCKELRITVPEDMKYYCISETVALYTQKYVQFRKRKMFFGKTGKIADVIPYMVKHKGDRFLIPKSEMRSDDLPKLLNAKGLSHTEAVMFRTVSNDFEPDEPFDYDMLVFFSPSGITSLFKNFPKYKQGDTAIATFGPTTARAAKDAGLKVNIEAPSPQHPSITAALHDYLLKVNGTEE